MPQTCTICKHPKRDEINQSLLAGEAYRNIAQRCGASPAAVFRHGKDHIPRALVKAKGNAEEVQADTLFGRLRALNRDTQEILKEARDSQNHVVALRAIGRAERQLELEARLLGELDNQTKVAIGISVDGHQSKETAKVARLCDLMTTAELEQFGVILKSASARSGEGTGLLA